MQTIHIGSDHAGFDLKNFLVRELSLAGYDLRDHGCASATSCDYPLIAEKVCKAVLADQYPGILICGTGLGMSMAANRHTGIRAALCTNEIMARMARRHNNANILCLGARIIGTELASAIVVAFLESSFEGGRHERRIQLLENNASKT